MSSSLGVFTIVRRNLFPVLINPSNQLAAGEVEAILFRLDHLGHRFVVYFLFAVSTAFPKDSVETYIHAAALGVIVGYEVIAD